MRNDLIQNILYSLLKKTFRRMIFCIRSFSTLTYKNIGRNDLTLNVLKSQLKKHRKNVLNSQLEKHWQELSYSKYFDHSAGKTLGGMILFKLFFTLQWKIIGWSDLLQNILHSQLENIGRNDLIQNILNR